MAPNRLPFAILTTLLALLLAACADPEFSTQDFRIAPGPSPAASCSLDDLIGNPSGLHRSGSVGGVGFASRVGLENVISAEALAGELDEAVSFGAGREDVAVLVVDDYGSAYNGRGRGVPVYDFGDTLFDATFEQIDGLPDNYIDDLTAFIDTLLLTGEMSHGALVFNHIVDLLVAFEPNISVIESEPGRIVLRRGAARIAVVAVEVSGLNTPQIRNVIDSAITAVTLEGFERAVVNMSFVLEACSLVAPYVAQRFSGGADSFEGYLQQRFPPTGLIPPGLGFEPAPPPDLFRQFVEGLATTEAVTLFVAAAGNNSRPGPQPPANWPPVVGVSAGQLIFDGTASSLLRSSFSNRGQVLAQGAWIELTRPGADLTPSDDVVVGGTSLAAPLATVFSALDLSQRDPYCDVGGGVPELISGLDDSADLSLAEAIARCL